MPEESSKASGHYMKVMGGIGGSGLGSSSFNAASNGGLQVEVIVRTRPLLIPKNIKPSISPFTSC